jgi:hypothetical protein
MDLAYGTACKLPTLSKTGTEEAFAAELQAMAQKIASLEVVRDNIVAFVDASAKSAVLKVYERQALTVFQQGLKNSEVRTVVVAGRPNSITDALQLAVTAKTAEPETKTKEVYHARTDLTCYRCNKKGHVSRNRQGNQTYNQGHG